MNVDTEFLAKQLHEIMDTNGWTARDLVSEAAKRNKKLYPRQIERILKIESPTTQRKIAVTIAEGIGSDFVIQDSYFYFINPEFTLKLTGEEREFLLLLRKLPKSAIDSLYKFIKELL